MTRFLWRSIIKPEVYEEVNRVEFNMTFVCCAKCGAVVAYSDHLLAGKLDEVIEVLLDLKAESARP